MMVTTQACRHCGEPIGERQFHVRSDYLIHTACREAFDAKGIAMTTEPTPALPADPIEKARLDRTERLPRWAQQRIAKLEADVAYYKEKLREGAESDTDTWVANFDGDIGLPRGSAIRFGTRYVGIEVSAIDDGCVYVRAETGRLLVEPQSNNTAKLWASDHRRQPNATG